MKMSNTGKNVKMLSWKKRIKLMMETFWMGLKSFPSVFEVKAIKRSTNTGLLLC